MKKINVALFALILSVSLFAAPLGLWAEETEVVATINGVEISQAEFHATLEEEFGSYVLQEMIEKELVRQKAAELDVSVDETEFAVMYQMIIQQIGGPEALQMFLLQNNATEQQFIEQIQWNMLVSSLAAAEVEVTDEAVEKWFTENRRFYDEPESVEVSHILVETEEEAQDLLTQLKDGADFADLAIEHSQDPGSGSAGGYIGAIQKGQTVAEFEAKAFSLEVEELGLAESNFGWHIILVHAKNEAIEAVFADIYDMVVRDYQSERALDAQSYMNKLHNEANIEVLWPSK